MNKQLLTDIKMANTEISIIFPSTEVLAKNSNVNNTRNTIPSSFIEVRRIVGMGGSEIIIYTDSTGNYMVDVRLKDDTLWLTQTEMANLYQTSNEEIAKQVKAVLEDKEYTAEETIKRFRITDENGKRRDLIHYNLDMVIAVGLRVKSSEAVRFRKWANGILKNYLIKGYVLNPAKLAYDTGYFDNLLRQIRELRAGEREIFTQLRELIKATSVDYDDHQADQLQKAFSILQNKLHYAITGLTGPEIIASRADGNKRNMGMTSWKGDSITEADTFVAKNYLGRTELEHYERLVSLFFDFANLQAKFQQKMTLDGWLIKVDGLLELSGREVLDNSGRVSRENAQKQPRKNWGNIVHELNTVAIYPIRANFIQLFQCAQCDTENLMTMNHNGLAAMSVRCLSRSKGEPGVSLGATLIRLRHGSGVFVANQITGGNHPRKLFITHFARTPVDTKARRLAATEPLQNYSSRQRLNNIQVFWSGGQSPLYSIVMSGWQHAFLSYLQ